MRVAAGAIARLIIPDVTIVARAGRDRRRGRPEPLGRDARASAKAERIRWAAIVECVAEGVPAGWGAPIYAKLDAELAAACMGINAVKGVEIGEGFAAARRQGSENVEAMQASGIDGGISTGQPIRLRVAFKPTSSIGDKGRHDPCVAIRGAPVVEAMVALVLADHKLLHRGAVRLTVAFEAVERLQAGVAAPLRLARGRAEAADFLGVGRAALRAGRGLGELGRGDAVGVEPPCGRAR